MWRDINYDGDFQKPFRTMVDGEWDESSYRLIGVWQGKPVVIDAKGNRRIFDEGQVWCKGKKIPKWPERYYYIKPETIGNSVKYVHLRKWRDTSFDKQNLENGNVFSNQLDAQDVVHAWKNHSWSFFETIWEQEIPINNEKPGYKKKVFVDGEDLGPMHYHGSVAGGFVLDAKFFRSNNVKVQTLDPVSGRACCMDGESGWNWSDRFLKELKSNQDIYPSKDFAASAKNSLMNFIKLKSK